MHNAIFETPFSIGFTPMSTDFPNTAKLARQVNLAGFPVAATPENLEACAYDTYDIEEHTFALSSSLNESCYPFAEAFEILTHQAYASSELDPECVVGTQTAYFTEFLMSGKRIARPLRAHLIGSLVTLRDLFAFHHDTGAREYIDFALVNRQPLDSITCDGHSILHIPHDLHNIPDSILSFAIAIYTCSMVICLGTAAWVLYYRQHRLVRNSSPAFLIQILVGTMVCMSTTLPLMQQDNHLSLRAIHDFDEQEGHIGKDLALDMACQAQPFLFSLGFGVMYSALLLKSWRLAKLFNNRKLRRLFISDARLLAYQAVVVTVVVSLNLIWVLADPLTWDRFPLAYDAHSGLVIESHGLCAFPNAATSMIPLVSMIFLYGVYLIYISRDVPTQFSESKWIGMSIVMMIEAMLLGVLVLVLSHEESTSGFVVKFLMVTLISMGTVVLIFLPKILLAYGYGGADVVKILKFIKPGSNSCSHSSKEAGKTSRTANNNSRHQLYGTTAVSSWFDLPESTVQRVESTFQDIVEEEAMGGGAKSRKSKDGLFKRGRADSASSKGSNGSKGSKSSRSSKELWGTP